MIVGQGPIALAVGTGGGCLDIFTLLYPFSPLSPSLGDGPIQTEILSERAAKPKTTNQQPKSCSGGCTICHTLCLYVISCVYITIMTPRIRTMHKRRTNGAVPDFIRVYTVLLFKYN